MGLTVELTGLPGSGKSTLAAAAADRLRERGVDVVVGVTAPGGRWRRLAYYSGECLRRPIYLLRSTAAVLASTQASPSDLRRGLLVWLKRSARAVAAADSGEVRLVDAGLFQALWSIAYSSRGEDPLRGFQTLHRSMPLPDAVLVVEANPETAAGRLRHRHGQASRLERDLEAGDEALLRAQSASTTTLEVLARCARTDPGLAVLRLANQEEGDVERNARKIVEFVLELLSSRHP